MLVAVTDTVYVVPGVSPVSEAVVAGAWTVTGGGVAAPAAVVVAVTV